MKHALLSRLLSLAGCVVAALLLVAIDSSRVSAAGRHALVVGIDRYDNLPADRQLQRAVTDAKAIAATLRGLAFNVIEAEDIARTAFDMHFKGLIERISPGDTVVVYFAGHGVEIDGRNLLLTRDAPDVRHGDEAHMQTRAVSLAGLLEQLRSRKPGVTLAIVDACRSNPFQRAGTRSLGGTRGLGVEQPPEGTFVLFAAGAGEEALDFVDAQDRDPHSLFARHMLPLMQQPGLEFPDLAREVRRRVRDAALAARHNQTPAYYDEVVGRFCLAGCDRAAAAARVGAAPPASVLPGEPPVHACDHSAAAALDHRKLVAGVAFEKINTVEAIRVCRAAMADFPGVARFEFQLGRAYERAGRLQDAARLYSAAAQRDDPGAMADLAAMYADGNGVPRNQAKALRLFRQAAALQNPPAMHNLASMYADGRGVERNVATAAEWYVAALSAGGTPTLAQFKTNASGYRPDVRRAIIDRLKQAGHYQGPASDTFSAGVLQAMTALVDGASTR